MSVLSQGYPRRVVINGAAIFCGEAIARLATFLMAVVVARRFGPVALGEYGYALALASILLLVPDMGLHLFMVRELSTDPRQLHEVFWNVHWLKLILTAAMVLCVLFYGSLWSPGSGRRILFFVLVVRLLLQTYSQASMAVFKACERMHFIALQQCVNSATVIVWACIALAMHASLPIVVMGLVAGQLMETLLGWRILDTYFRPGPPCKWNRRAINTILAASVPIGLTAIFQAFNQRIDIFVLGHYVSDQVLGEFQAAAWFPVGTFLVASLLMAAVLPKLSRLCGGHSPYENAYIRSLVKNGMLLMGLGGLFVGFSAPALLRLFFGKDLASSADTLRLLAPVLPLIFLNTVLFYVFVAAGRRAVYLGTLGVGAMTGTVLCIWLTPAYGPAGCAVADGVRELVISAIYLVCFLRSERIRTTGTAFLKVLGGATLLTVIGMRLAAPIYSTERLVATWMILVVAGTIYLLGLPSRREWRLLTDDNL